MFVGTCHFCVFNFFRNSLCAGPNIIVLYKHPGSCVKHVFVAQTSLCLYTNADVCTTIITFVPHITTFVTMDTNELSISQKVSPSVLYVLCVLL